MWDRLEVYHILGKLRCQDIPELPGSPGPILKLLPGIGLRSLQGAKKRHTFQFPPRSGRGNKLHGRALQGAKPFAAPGLTPAKGVLAVSIPATPILPFCKCGFALQ